MGTVTVKLFVTTRERFNHDSVQISGNTFVEVIGNLIAEYPELKGTVVNEDMSLKRNFIYLLNGRNAQFLKKGETLIRDGDKISIFPLAGGG